MMPRVYVVAVLLIIGLAAQVRADFEDGAAALGRGAYATAHAEFLALAKQGNRDAPFALGQMHHLGTGFPQNDAVAFKWYREAAELGHPGAQSILGFMHAYGVGTRQDILEGYIWFSLAAAQGNPIAEDNRDKLARVLTADQRTEADIEAAKRQLEIDVAIARLRSGPKTDAPAETEAVDKAPRDIPIEPAGETATAAPPKSRVYRVQLGAFKIPENAPVAWQRFQRLHPDLLGELQADIRSVELGDRGMFHILRVGRLADAQSAEYLCGSLLERGVDCLVVKP